jgi:hypothetical protein
MDKGHILFLHDHMLAGAPEERLEQIPSEFQASQFHNIADFHGRWQKMPTSHATHPLVPPFGFLTRGIEPFPGIGSTSDRFDDTPERLAKVASPDNRAGIPFKRFKDNLIA